MAILRHKSVRFLVLDEHETFIYRVLEGVSGEDALAALRTFSLANPATSTYACILDLRRFGGMVSDSDVADTVLFFRRMRVERGFPEYVNRPQVIMSMTAPGAEGLTMALNRSMTHTNNFPASSVDQAWAIIAPGLPVPKNVRRFLI